MTELELAILVVLEAGLTVENKRGGYVCKNEPGVWTHQLRYRSTHNFNNPDEMLQSFLTESDLR